LAQQLKHRSHALPVSRLAQGRQPLGQGLLDLLARDGSALAIEGQVRGLAHREQHAGIGARFLHGLLGHVKQLIAFRHPHQRHPRVVLQPQARGERDVLRQADRAALALALRQKRAGAHGELGTGAMAGGLGGGAVQRIHNFTIQGVGPRLSHNEYLSLKINIDNK
jgi:hypothetical protein